MQRLKSTAARVTLMIAVLAGTALAPPRVLASQQADDLSERVLEYVHKAWGRPVRLNTIDGDGKEKTLKRD